MITCFAAWCCFLSPGQLYYAFWEEKGKGYTLQYVPTVFFTALIVTGVGVYHKLIQKLFMNSFKTQQIEHSANPVASLIFLIKLCVGPAFVFLLYFLKYS